MVSRISEVQSLLDDHRKRHEDTVILLETQLQKSRDQVCSQLGSIQASLDRQETNSNTILSVAKSALGAVNGLQQMVDRIYYAVLSLQDVASRALYLRSLDPTKGLPIILEDALGNIREIPLDWVNSWEV